MLQLIFNLLGIDYNFDITDSAFEQYLPFIYAVLICVSLVLVMYLTICFFQFVRSLLNRK